jgi:hypothetical protein
MSRLRLDILLLLCLLVIGTLKRASAACYQCSYTCANSKTLHQQYYSSTNAAYTVSKSCYSYQYVVLKKFEIATSSYENHFAFYIQDKQSTNYNDYPSLSRETSSSDCFSLTSPYTFSVSTIYLEMICLASYSCTLYWDLEIECIDKPTSPPTTSTPSSSSGSSNIGGIIGSIVGIIVSVVIVYWIRKLICTILCGCCDSQDDRHKVVNAPSAVVVVPKPIPDHTPSFPVAVYPAPSPYIQNIQLSEYSSKPSEDKNTRINIAGYGNSEMSPQTFVKFQASDPGHIGESDFEGDQVDLNGNPPPYIPSSFENHQGFLQTTQTKNTAEEKMNNEAIAMIE